MKTAHSQVRFKKGAIHIAGMTKGSGMIQPNMATTLGFVMMDADIGPGELRAMLSEAVEYSYNRISVDSDTSTNDTLLLLANGASGLAPNDNERDLVREALLVADHNAYHLGQLLDVRRALGAWKDS